MTSRDAKPTGTLDYMSYGLSVALNNQIEIMKNWISKSYRLGKLIPNSLYGPSIQQIGQLDCILRQIESENLQISDRKSDNELHMLGFNLYVILCASFINKCYEMLRIVNERKLFNLSNYDKELFKDLTALRITLDKHEIAGPVGKDEPINFFKDTHQLPIIYSKSDPLRAHVMPMRLSARGSMEYHAFDTIGHRWLERQALSDRILQMELP